MAYKKAQSIVEYLLLIGVLIIVILIGAANVGSKTQRQYATAGNLVDETANVFADEMGVDRPASVSALSADVSMKAMDPEDTRRYKNALNSCKDHCKDVNVHGKSSCMADCMESKGYTR